MKRNRTGTILIAGLLVLGLASCCTKRECDLRYESPAFIGFTAQDLDTVVLIVEDMDGRYPPDSITTQAVFYDQDSLRVSLVTTLPFNKERRYVFSIPATGAEYVLDGYEFSREVCNKCFAASSDDGYDKLQAYRVNGVRKEGLFFEITK